MKKLFALASLVVVSTLSSFGDTLAQWTFESNTTGNYLPGTGTTTSNYFAEAGLQAGTAAATGLHAGAATYSSPTGNGSAKSLSVNTWAVGDYWQIALNTTGYSGLSLSYDQTGSSTGPRDFVLSYSLNGTSFTTIGSTYTVALNTWTAGTPLTGFTQTYDLGSITDINDASSVYFRITDVDTTSVGGATVATGGTDRIDNVMVFTTPVPEPSSAVFGILGGVVGLIWWRRRH
jgi:hypothetical protein